MPIKFRCPHCRQFLGISRSKANSLTDCPTCGRTIRIPNLDGKVAAVPKPKLDMQDSELVRALGALANLKPVQEDNRASENDLESLGSDPLPHTFQPDLVEVLERPAPVKILPELIEEPEEPLSVIAEYDEPTANSEEQILASLALASSSQPSAKLISTKKGARFGPGSLLLACLVCLACGGVIGRALFPNNIASPEKTTQIDKPIEIPDVLAVPDKNLNEGFQISGKLTYTSATGDSLPDREAGVIILPIERIGTAKLSVAGFRIGASPADQALLSAELQSLGGDFVLAGKDGTFSAVLPKAGRYGVLIASRYQIRSQEVIPPGPIMDLVASYFERPAQLIGKVQYHYQTFSAASTSETLDHHFKLE